MIEHPATGGVQQFLDGRRVVVNYVDKPGCQ
jgi:hypothetical protein